jgi:hypothetical protein
LSHGVCPRGESLAGVAVHYNHRRWRIGFTVVPVSEVKMPARPNRLKRGLFWTGVALGLLMLYVASCPFVIYSCARTFDKALPIVQAVYAPLQTYCMKELPGTRAYGRYLSFCIRMLERGERGDVNARLDAPTVLQLLDAPLRDTLSYACSVHDVQFELLDGVDGSVRVDLNSTTGTLRDALESVLHPLGLAAVPLGNKIVVGPAVTVERIAAEARAEESGRKLRGNLIILGGFVLMIGVIVLILRRRASRRRVTVNVSAGQTT